MTRKEFDAIVADAVAAGADPKEAADYVVRGFKLPCVPKDGVNRKPKTGTSKKQAK